MAPSGDWLTLAVLFQGYVCYTIARRGVACAASELQGPPLLLSKSDIGAIQSSFTTTYGISKMAGSIISDRAPCRLLFSAGLVVAACANAAATACDSTLLFSLCWGLNGAVQGLGWPAVAQIIVRVFPPEKRGFVWGALTISGNLAKTLSPVILAAALGVGGWRCVFGASAALAGFSAALTLACLPPGVGSATRRKGDDSPEAVGFWRDMARVRPLACSASFWALVLANALAYFVLQVLSDWSLPLLREAYGLTADVASSCVAAYEAGGVAGSLLSGIVSDMLGGEGSRNLTSLLYTASLVPTIIVMWCIPAGAPWLLHAVVLFCLGFTVYGPKTMGGITAREDHGELAGLASGVLALGGQWGASAAGYPVGYLIERWSWGGMFWSLLTASAVTLLLFILLALHSASARAATKQA